MNQVWMIKDIRAYFLVYRLARGHKVQPGESMQKEFEAVQKKHPEWFECLGQTEKDADLITGDLRENGLKIMNLSEEERKRKHE